MPPRAHHDDLLATDFGVEALHEAAADRGISTAAWPSPADADALVDWLLARADDPPTATILERARIRVGYRGPALPRVSFLGKTEQPLDEPARVLPVLEQAIVAELRARGFPGETRMSVVTEQGIARFVLLLPSRWARFGVEGGGRRARVPHVARDAHVFGRVPRGRGRVSAPRRAPHERARAGRLR